MLLIRWRLILKPTLLPVRKLEGPQKIIIILDVRKLKGLNALNALNFWKYDFWK